MLRWSNAGINGQHSDTHVRHADSCSVDGAASPSTYHYSYVLVPAAVELCVPTMRVIRILCMHCGLKGRARLPVGRCNAALSLATN